MTAAEKQVDDLRRAGATDKQVDQATGLQKNIDAMAAWRKEQEEANKLIEESRTPIEKYQDQIDKIQKMYLDGLLTESQADAAIDKAAKGLDKDDKETKKASLETRRFDFRLPSQQPEKADKAAELAATAKATLESQKQVEFYQQQQYQWGLDAQQNTDVLFRTV